MRTTAEETQRNDEIIIAAAIKVFSEKGYDAASMQDIADEAKVSRGPLYYRYKTKKDIYLAAMDAYAKQELGEQARILRQKKPGTERLSEYLHFGSRFARKNSAIFPMDISTDPAMEDVNERIREIYSWSATMLRKFIESAIEAGEIKPGTDVDGLVNFLFIIYDGLRYSHVKSGIIPTPEQVEKTIDQITDLMIAGYGIE